MSAPFGRYGAPRLALADCLGGRLVPAVSLSTGRRRHAKVRDVCSGMSEARYSTGYEGAVSVFFVGAASKVSLPTWRSGPVSEGFSAVASSVFALWRRGRLLLRLELFITLVQPYQSMPKRGQKIIW